MILHFTFFALFICRYYPSSAFCATYPDDFIVAYVFPFNWCYGGVFRTAYYTSSCNSSYFNVKAFDDQSCKTKMYNISTPTNACLFFSAGNSYYSFRCITRPDPTANPTRAPIPFPTRAPVAPIFVTAAPLKPTKAPLLNPASQLTYPPSSRPTLNITKLVKTKKKKHFNWWWLILICGTILFCCLIGCLGYKRAKKKRIEKEAAEKRRVRQLKEEEALNSAFSAAAVVPGAIAGAGAPGSTRKKKRPTNRNVPIIPPPASTAPNHYHPLTQEEKKQRKKNKIPPPAGSPRAAPRAPSPTQPNHDEETKEPNFGTNSV